MAVSFEQFFSAISEQESGGNYKAVGVWVGSDRAYGKYQVMGANIPSWTKKYLGYSMTPQQYLNSPSAQEKVARGVLSGYYKKYGAEGAAAMWYSGQSNPNKTYGNPPVYKYVNSVIAKAGRYPSSGGGSSPSAKSGGGGEAPMSRAETAESYGFMESLFDSVPELKKLFDKAIKGGYSAGKFQAELRDTKWWKTKSSTARDFLILQYGDPASAKQKLDQATVRVRQLVETLGIRAGAGIESNIKKWALNVAMDGWDDSRLRWDIGKYLNFTGDVRQGEGGEAIDKLRDYAYNMGVTMTTKWYADSARAIVRGTGTQQDYEDILRRQAKALFPEWSKQLDYGQTVADIASPYFSSMSQILELPPGSINLFDPLIKKTLQNKDKVTGQAIPKPLWQFEQDLRNDPRWKSTQNAQNSVMQVAHQVLADFGVKY